MNVGFAQPDDFKLETAIILVTLESPDAIRAKGGFDAVKQQLGVFSLKPSRIQLMSLGPMYVLGRETETYFSRLETFRWAVWESISKRLISITTAGCYLVRCWETMRTPVLKS